MKISERLRQVADEYLWDGSFPVKGEQFICHAICMAYGINNFTRDKELPEVQFLEELGMPLDGNGFLHWQTSGYTPRSPKISDDTQQQVRYAWLQLAADFAEEEGQ